MFVQYTSGWGGGEDRERQDRSNPTCPMYHNQQFACEFSNIYTCIAIVTILSC